MGLLVDEAEQAGDETTLAAIRAEAAALGSHDTDDGTPSMADRVDTALARVGGEHATRAAARVLSGPLANRLNVQTAHARLFGAARADMVKTLTAHYAADRVEATRTALVRPLRRCERGCVRLERPSGCGLTAVRHHVVAGVMDTGETP